MDERTGAPLLRGTYRATISGVGRPGPIEERVGRRLIRVVDPDSREGATLARSGIVMWVGPEGEALGCLGLPAVRRILRKRFEQRLGASTSDRADAIRDGLDRLGRGGLTPRS